jgi:hypothetical protein
MAMSFTGALLYLLSVLPNQSEVLKHCSNVYGTPRGALLVDSSFEPRSDV